MQSQIPNPSQIPFDQLVLRCIDANGPIPFDLIQSAGSRCEKVPWTPPQTFEQYRESARGGRLFAASIDDCIVATFMLHAAFDHGHDAIELSKLAVAVPRKGIGTWCLRQAEAIATKEKREALVLRARSDIEGLASFYTAFGFEPRDESEIEYESELIPVTLYEKLLT